MIIQQRLQSSLAPFDRPCCPECGSAMFLVEVEPDAPGSESRSYECPQCKFTERSVVQMLSSAIAALAGSAPSARS